MARTDIKWADELRETVGNANAGWALGPPDGDEWAFAGRESATFAGWSRASYDGLAELLGGAIPPGDVVTPALLESADVIAWELNGTSPAKSGGWESCRWIFR